MEPQHPADGKRMVLWQGRISAEQSERLLEYGNLLREKGKIKRTQKYHILRFALESLLATLERQFPRAQPPATPA